MPSPFGRWVCDLLELLGSSRTSENPIRNTPAPFLWAGKKDKQAGKKDYWFFHSFVFFPACFSVSSMSKNKDSSVTFAFLIVWRKRVRSVLRLPNELRLIRICTTGSGIPAKNSAIILRLFPLISGTCLFNLSIMPEQ